AFNDQTPNEDHRAAVRNVVWHDPDDAQPELPSGRVELNLVADLHAEAVGKARRDVRPLARAQRQGGLHRVAGAVPAGRIAACVRETLAAAGDGNPLSFIHLPWQDAYGIDGTDAGDRYPLRRQ